MAGRPGKGETVRVVDGGDIRFDGTVVEIEPTGDGRWVVEVDGEGSGGFQVYGLVRFEVDEFVPHPAPLRSWDAVLVRVLRDGE